MKYYIIAGEASGDLHGAHLVRSLLSQDKHADIRAWGGDLMSDAGADVVRHISDLAFMGFWEVMIHLRQIAANFRYCKRDVMEWQPDVLVMIDFPGFNLKLVKWFHDRGVKIVYYISPQVWAWKEKRVKDLKLYVDRLIVILPFEKPYYADHGLEVDYVGHPLLDHIGHQAKSASDHMIGIIPGSRRQEISAMLPIMLQAAAEHPDYRYEVAMAPGMEDALYHHLIGDTTLDISLRRGATYEIMSTATAAMVTSGTATLETALHDTPMVVCYRGNWISFQIAKRLVSIKYISLVNLILDEPLVPELIQSDLVADRLLAELNPILKGPARDRQLDGFRRLREVLGGAGASDRAAAVVRSYAER